MSDVDKGRDCVIAEESVEDVKTDISFQSMLRKHYEEIATDKSIPLEPWFEKYEAMQKAGSLLVIVGRDDAGAAVCYATYIIQYHAHYSSTLFAIQDLFFVRADHRNKGYGSLLIEASHGALEDKGVAVVMQHQKIAHPELGALLDKAGYAREEIIWRYRLGGK